VTELWLPFYGGELEAINQRIGLSPSRQLETPKITGFYAVEQSS
jgi:hypothetical protein